MIFTSLDACSHPWKVLNINQITMLSMELHYTSYVAGMGTRQPTEHHFYSPDLDFAVILHQPLCMEDVTFPRFEFGESSRIKDDYKGAVKKVNIPDKVVRILFEKGKQFSELSSSLEGIIQQLMQAKG